MPLHTVERDLSEGRLVKLLIEDVTPGSLIMPMSAVYPTSAPPGPAGRWLIERLKGCSNQIPAAA
jgi:DNA-binding transcriptional LysR family regulator